MSTPQKMKDIAKRGLNLDHKIDTMLSDFWCEFTAIEPTLAKKLEKSFGSAEFSALMIIGRFKDPSSIIEGLPTNPLSEESINNILNLPSEFVAQLTQGITESARGETTDYEFDDQITLFKQAERARKQYEQKLVRIFRQLKEDDSEVASAALALWEDENDAANYLASPVRSLADKSPLEALEKGDRQEVLDLLLRLEYGIFS